jgi:hypothetical protein
VAVRWASHPADAFMEGAARMIELEPPPVPKKIIVPPMDRAFTLEGLWETANLHRESDRI